MSFLESSLREIPRYLALIVFLFFCSCQNEADLNTQAEEVLVIKSNALGVLDLTSDAFELSSTKESQLLVFNSLFNGVDGYRLPGDPSADTLLEFFNELRNGYLQKDEGIDYSHIRKEYHTFTHAMDVMITAHALLNSGGAVYLTSGERASLLIAALGHDVLHTGVNNSFLIETKHPYYLELGENSLQEKRSARYILELLDKHGILLVEDDMSDEQKKEIRELRNLIEQSILWTDIKRHAEQMKAMSEATEKILNALNQAREEEQEGEIRGAGETDIDANLDVSTLLDSEARVLIASFILHCADISNPGKSWESCERWAGLVMNEFFSQGDLQKKLGLKPSMNCDRSSVSIPACQIGFGKFIIRDLYELLSKILHDGGGQMVERFNSNHEKWQELQALVEKTGIPYAIQFSPPSQEGGWIGKLRVGEE
jgi:hypothetical protein